MTERQEVSAGPVRALLDGTELRRFTVAGEEYLASIYFAVRNPSWDTIQPELVEHEIHVGVDDFSADFCLRHLLGEGALNSRLTVRGDASGSIYYEFESVVAASFDANRIGLCALFPASLADRRVVFETVAGSVSRRFPARVAPWPVCSGITGLRYSARPDAEVAMAFAGDAFEMEDQRNWTDGSYKIYSRPLSAPKPVRLVAGTKISQAVTVCLTQRRPSKLTRRPRLIHEIRVSAEPVGTVPQIGFGAARLGRAMEDTERQLIAALHPGHLRVEADLSKAGWQEAVHEADQAAAELSCGLFLDVVADSEGDELDYFEPVFREVKSRVERIFGYDRRLHVTTKPVAERIAKIIADSNARALLCGGTRSNFAHLNRVPVPLQALDCVGYAVSPQVHAFDDQSIVETLVGQAATVESAHAIAGSLPLAVGPVTLLPPYNPFATGASLPEHGPLPPTVDPRQRTAFLAAWTVGSLAAMLPRMLSAVTYYETLGWKGLAETATGSPQPRLFPSRPLEIFPVYHVLAAVGEVAASPSARMLRSRTTAQSGLHACALGDAAKSVVLLANLTEVVSETRVRLPEVFRWTQQMIDETGKDSVGLSRGLDVGATLELPGRSVAVLRGSAR